MANLKVMIPLSTRAGVIKFAPVIKAMQADQVNFEPVVVWWLLRKDISNSTPF